MNDIINVRATATAIINPMVKFCLLRTVAIRTGPFIAVTSLKSSACCHLNIPISASSYSVSSPTFNYLCI